MVGDERARFCSRCQKDVFNLSAMPRDEAESFMRERTGDVCVRLYRRVDGTVLTSDCPVGVKRKRRRKAAFAAVGGGLLAAGALLNVRSAPTATPLADRARSERDEREVIATAPTRAASAAPIGPTAPSRRAR